MARHHRMPPEEAGYTYAVEPAAIDRLLANEEESIYRHLTTPIEAMIRNGWPTDVTAQTLQFLALIRTGCHARMQGETEYFTC